MKVFHIDRQRSWTGQTSRQLEILRELNAHGHSCGVVVHPGSELGRRAGESGIEVLTVPMRGWRWMPTVVELAAALRHRSVDILHAHGARDHLIAVLVAGPGRVRHVVRTKHNHSPLRNRWSRLVFQRSSATVAVSEFVRRMLVDQGLPAEHVITIATAVDVERFQPRARDAELARTLGIGERDVVLGNVSSLHRRKGIDTLLRAFRRLCDAPPGERPLRCLLAGKEHAQWRPLVRELGLEGRVLFPGFQQDVPPVLSLFDVFVLPSRDEALGTSVLEAMAAGLPVVVGDVGGLKESVAPGTGLRVPAEDPTALEQALRQLLEDPAQAAEMGAAARRRVLEHYSRQAMVGRTLELYETLLDQGATRRPLLAGAGRSS